MMTSYHIDVYTYIVLCIIIQFNHMIMMSDNAKFLCTRRRIHTNSFYDNAMIDSLSLFGHRFSTHLLWHLVGSRGVYEAAVLSGGFEWICRRPAPYADCRHSHPGNIKLTVKHCISERFMSYVQIEKWIQYI